jgi:hypothetical protein
MNQDLTKKLYEYFEMNAEWMDRFVSQSQPPIDFECETEVEKGIMECIVRRIQDLPTYFTGDNYQNYILYTSALVDRYISQMEIQYLFNGHYYRYMNVIRNSVKRVKYYIEYRLLNNIDQPNVMIDDIQYTDASSDDESEEGEEYNIDVSLLVCPSKLLKQSAQCPICMDSHIKKEMVSTDCGHWFCPPCFSGLIERASSTSPPKCPLCRKLIFQIAAPTLELYRELEFSPTHSEQRPTDTPEV